MKFYNRKTGTPIAAIQYTDRASVERIKSEMCCDVSFHYDFIVADGTTVRIGEYAVLAMFAIVAMDQETFNRRHTKNEIQLELI